MTRQESEPPMDLLQSHRAVPLTPAEQAEAEAQTKGYPEFDPDQPRDDSGRWSGGGGGGGEEPGGSDYGAIGSNAAAASLQRRLSEPDGGFSVNMVTGREPTTGYMVSIYPDRSMEKPAVMLRPVDLKRYIKANREVLHLPGRHFGAWHDPKTGRVWFDISVRVETAAEAEALGQKHGQLAYFDLAAGRSIDIAPRRGLSNDRGLEADPRDLRGRRPGRHRGPDPLVRGNDGAPGDPGGARRVGGHLALHALAAALEPALRRAFLAAVEQSQRAIDIEHIAQLLLSGQIDAAAAASGIQQLTAGLSDLTPVLQMGFTQAGQHAASVLTQAGLRIAFDMTNPRAQAWAAKYSSVLITQISDQTREGVRQLIETAFAEGVHPYDTAKRIRDWVGLLPRQQEAVASFARRLHEAGLDPEVVERRTARYARAQLRYRTEMIARTETLASSNHGQQELWQQAEDRGLLRADRTLRVWLVTDDDRLDADTCEPMEDQKVGLREPFITPQGRALMVPPAHPNCRCAVGLEIE